MTKTKKEYFDELMEDNKRVDELIEKFEKIYEEAKADNNPFSANIIYSLSALRAMRDMQISMFNYLYVKE